MAGEFEIEENLAGWKAIERALETLRAGGSYVKAGVIGDAAAKEEHGEGGKLTNATLAAIHEFGTAKIPARPFILGTFTLNGAKYRALLAEKVLPAVLRLKITPAQGLKILGEIMASDMRNRIVEGDGIPPPLAPSTVKKKLAKGRWKGPDGGASDGMPRPLVDTGRLRNSISYAVVVQEEEG